MSERLKSDLLGGGTLLRLVFEREKGNVLTGQLMKLIDGALADSPLLVRSSTLLAAAATNCMAARISCGELFDRRPHAVTRGCARGSYLEV